MSYFFIFLSFLFVTELNDPDPGTLNISSTEQVQLSADRIQFNITINARADNPQEAYEMHQEKEDVLVGLLREYNIDEENIQYEPVSIRDYQEAGPGDREIYYRTTQTVNVTFSNFDIYEEIQVTLIENNFDNFNGVFLSTQKEEGKNEALRKAIQKAKAKAQLIAEEAGVDLGAVVNISYNSQPVRPYEDAAVAMKSVESSNLLDYKQTVTVFATVSMEFEILG